MWHHARCNMAVIDGDRRCAASMMKNRLSILSVFFISAYLLIAVRLLDLGVVQGLDFRADGISDVGAQSVSVKEITPRRGDVYDRNGFLVATSLKTPSLFVDPYLVLDANALSESLSKVLPDFDKEKSIKIMSAKNRFGWLAYDITPKQQQAILEIGDPSLGFKYNYKRIYPQGSLFAHLVGYTDRDGLGLSGVERGFDDVLARGDDVSLSLDLRLQHAVKREVSKAIADFNAKAGVGVILDAKTGELLAGVSLPDFDLNAVSDAKNNQKFNRLTLGVYELGSIFKIFSTAALLEFKKVSMGRTFDARKPIKVGWFTISDYHAQGRFLTVAEVFMYSSNIGTALMAKMIGGRALKAFYKDLGLLDRLRFDIKEIGRPIIPKQDIWREDSAMTISYGHGISVSPLQMSVAVASIVNGGIALQPTLIKKEEGYRPKSEVRVISEKTSLKMRKLLRLAVNKGTGKNANLEGIAIGGKTGTADKSVNGRYRRDKRISSFVGAFPIHDPEYIVMVMIDEPKGNKSSNGYATAGWVAAPAVKRIVNSMVSILGIPTDKYNPASDISLDLMPYVHDKNKRRKRGKTLASYQ